MERYTVTGMSCAACSTRVEKAVCALEGVESCTVNLLTGKMNVEGAVSPDVVISAVTAAGYQATLNRDSNKIQKNEAKKIENNDSLVIKKRLVASVCFLAVLMYLSMGHTMFNLPLPRFLETNPLSIGLCQMILSAIVMVINGRFFINGTKGIIKRAPNMDTLVAMGSFASFAYSVYSLFVMSDATVKGDLELANSYLHQLYFESAAMILTLITVGKLLEARAKGKTTNALESLMKLAPKTATVIRGDKEVTVLIDEVRVGEVFIIRPGEQVPVDGVVVSGTSAVNESAITGESIPVDKEKGSTVSTGTLNMSGVLKCEATRVGEDTTLSQIIRMVSDASATKAPIAKIADKVSGVFVPAVLAIALITFIVWILLDESLGFSIARAISVLVISCPCALGLATPVAIMVGTGVGAKNGILFKTAISLEQTGKAKIVVLDKTGTITEGNPSVKGLYPVGECDEKTLLSIAASLEKNSEHPLAKAVIKKANEDGIEIEEVSDFAIHAGSGVTAKLNGEELYGGNLLFVQNKVKIESFVKNQAEKLSENGLTPLFFAKNDRLVGIIAVADTVRDDSVQAIAKLKELGVRVVMLTGDNECSAKAIASQVGINEVIAGVLPEEKEKAIRNLQQQGKVVMVGDGINDAVALTRADIGVAIGAGTDVAIDAADIVLVKSRISDVVATIKLSRATLRTIHQNLFWAFIYNVVGIPLAAGALYPIFGWQLNPMFGAAAMSLSSFCVVYNALRLNFVKIKSKEETKTQDKLKPFIESEENKQPKVQKTKKVLKIQGMMCAHCEDRVKKCLEALEGVDEAVISLREDTATVTLSADVSDEVLKNAVEAQDYSVIGIE
ncbi:MAG: heavy metal translocating P-type ATPase [Clostridia bacterium]|nr:heavy metal translocating P-type ATPase [Clostridia bacterium]